MGKTIAEGKCQPFVKVPVFWSARRLRDVKLCYDDADIEIPVEGQQLRYCGVGAGFDDVYIDGNPEELKVRSPHRRGKRSCY